MNKKPSNHSIKAKEYTTKRNWGFIATELKQWSLKEDSHILEEFYTNLDIPHETFYDNVRNNPILKEAHVFALTRLGINREKHCVKHNLSMNSVMANSLPDYNERWKKNIEWRNSLKVQVAQNTTNQPIVQYIVDGMLPPKKPDNKE